MRLAKTLYSSKVARLIMLSGALTLLPTVALSSHSSPSAGGPSDSSVVSGDDITIKEDDENVFACIAKIGNTSRDTLHTYTLSGLRLDGRRKNSARTLYNIIIKNGRKVVKR